MVADMIAACRIRVTMRAKNKEEPVNDPFRPRLSTQLNTNVPTEKPNKPVRSTLFRPHLSLILPHIGEAIKTVSAEHPIMLVI